MELITVEELGTDLWPIFDRISRSHEALSVKGKGNQSIVILDAKDYRKLVRHRHPERQTETKQPRPVGLAKGIFQVPPSFFEELPEELLICQAIVEYHLTILTSDSVIGQYSVRVVW